MTREKMLEVHTRIKPFIHNTSVLTSRLIDEISDAEIFFKCENFQKGGAYKIRGATNAILSLKPEERKRGVVTHSSGNFAQALSIGASAVGADAIIVMPKNAPEVKKSAVRTYKGEIIESESNAKAREDKAEEVKKDRGATFIHPSNDDNVIYGQGTAAMELLEEHPDLEYIIVPVGGGGLIAGTALAAKYFSDNCEVIGTEPMTADDAYRSLKSGKIEYNESTNTIADGLRTNLGDRNFPIIKKEIKQIIRVEENEIIHAMKLIWERMKIVVEPSSAVALAGLLKEKEQFKGRKVGIILSGGNVDLKNLPF